jgi:hypothetical protein
VRTLGLHLVQSVDLIDTPRRSVVVELDAAGMVSRVVPSATTAEIVEAIGAEPALVVVDAPLVVPNDGGQRDVERILGWCDVPAFPVSRARLAKVHGGSRGVEFGAALPPGVTAIETHPDLVLRLLMWEDAGGGAPIDLADYRAQWLGLRAPTYRPKGPGRANPAGIVAAAAILARHVDLAGWTPIEPDDDWGPIRDAATLDAIICAYVASRAIHTPEATLRIGAPSRGQMLVPVDANLGDRLTATVARLADEGAIGIA